MDKILHDLKDSKLWENGIFHILGNAGFCPSTVGFRVRGLGFTHIGSMLVAFWDYLIGF